MSVLGPEDGFAFPLSLPWVWDTDMIMSLHLFLIVDFCTFLCLLGKKSHSPLTSVAPSFTVKLLLSGRLLKSFAKVNGAVYVIECLPS